jgi:hypothetical protein
VRRRRRGRGQLTPLLLGEGETDEKEESEEAEENEDDEEKEDGEEDWEERRAMAFSSPASSTARYRSTSSSIFSCNL